MRATFFSVDTSVLKLTMRGRCRGSLQGFGLGSLFFSGTVAVCFVYT